jgi:hypothetical protein
MLQPIRFQCAGVWIVSVSQLRLVLVLVQRSGGECLYCLSVGQQGSTQNLG